MKKTTIFFLSLSLYSATFAQEWTDNVQLDLGIGIMNPMKLKSNPHLKLSPHIGLAFKDQLYKRFDYSVGLEYHYKPFYSTSIHHHQFYRDGQLNDQISKSTYSAVLHQLALPITIYYNFPQVKYAPYVFVGVMPQWNFAGQYHEDISLAINKDIINSSTKDFNINDDKLSHKVIRGNTQYTIGIGARVSLKSSIQLSYLKIRSFQFFNYINGFEDIRGASFYDSQLRVSWQYKF